MLGEVEDGPVPRTVVERQEVAAGERDGVSASSRARQFGRGGRGIYATGAGRAAVAGGLERTSADGGGDLLVGVSERNAVA